MGKIHGDLVKAQECIQQLGKTLALLAQKVEPAQIKHHIKEATGLLQAFVHSFCKGALYRCCECISPVARIMRISIHDDSLLLFYI